MASIGGLSSTASSGMNSAGSIKGFGGLASGLDRDSLIENMTYATRKKIANQKQKMQVFQWQQSAMQSITSKLYEFSSKYMSYTSSSNLTSSKLFSRNVVTALGENSKYLSVTGSGTTADTISVLGVKSLAKNAQMISSNAVSDQILKTGSISNNMGDEIPLDMVSGDSMYITYGTKTYSVALSSAYDYSSTDAAVASVNKALSDVTIGTDKTLADVMEVTESGGKLTFVNKDTAGNNLVLSGSTGDLLTDLGFMTADEKFGDLSAERIMVTKEGLEAVNNAEFQKNTSIRDVLSGKKISFSYNGTIKWITLDKYNESSDLETVEKDLQSKLNDAFGKGRISVELTPSDDSSKSYFAFAAVKPDGEPDESSSLAITAADKGILGDAANTVFGIRSGESNRLNLSASIANSGLNAAGKSLGGEMIIQNGDKSVNLKDLNLSWDSSVSEIINAINNSKELGIKVSYQSNIDKFVVQSTEQGASGKIDLSGNLASVLFGEKETGDYTVEQGQDAVICVQYAGSNTASEITRGSNTIAIDGLNITLKGTFGYDGEGYVSDTSPVTFDASVDTDKTTSIVKEMIDAYNEALSLINSEVKQKPDRDYSPLTDEQREEMSESQIEKWETEAKKGLLFNDTDLKGLADGLRFIIPSGLRADLQKMGITVSTSYSDNGKLVFNETEFKAALGTDPEAVMQAFTSGASKNEDGTTNPGGLMTSMKTVMDRYASMTGATKGILVERAGSVYAPTSVLKNGMQTQIDSIKDYITQLNKKLATEQDRYVSQFTALETLISQMNSQSSYLSSMFSS